MKIKFNEPSRACGLCWDCGQLSLENSFISGSICPSTPFERHRRFISLSKRAADSQNFLRLSNTDAPVYVYRRAVFPALRWRSSEMEKKLSNRLAASSFFQSFWHDRRRQSPISQLIYQISQLIFDRSHVNASHDVSACKVIDLRTMDSLCVRHRDLAPVQIDLAAACTDSGKLSRKCEYPP